MYVPYVLRSMFSRGEKYIPVLYITKYMHTKKQSYSCYNKTRPYHMSTLLNNDAG